MRLCRICSGKLQLDIGSKPRDSHIYSIFSNVFLFSRNSLFAKKTPECLKTRKMTEQSDAPNPYKLALGLLKHPNRQLSGAGDRGR